MENADMFFIEGWIFGEYHSRVYADDLNNVPERFRTEFMRGFHARRDVFEELYREDVEDEMEKIREWGVK